MANRWYNQFRKQLNKETVSVFFKVSFAGTGAPTLVTSTGAASGTTTYPGASLGVSSIARNSAGDYTVTLQDAFTRILMINYSYDESGNTGTAPVAATIYVKNYNVGSTGTSPKTVEFVTANSTGGKVDPVSGEAAWFEFVLQNSTAV